MLRNLHLLLISILALTSTRAGTGNEPFVLQPYLGAAAPIHSGAHAIGLQGGIKYTPVTIIPIYLGFDEILLHSNEKSTWPDVGTYRYNITSSLFSLDLGLHALREKRVSVDMGISWDFIYSKARLETDNATLKDFLLDRYERRYQSIAGFLHVNGKINKTLSAFLRVSLHNKQYTNNQVVLGCGLAYNIYNIQG